MKREELEVLGLTKEQVDKVLDAHHAELGPVQKKLETAEADLKAANETVETQKSTIKELKTDLAEFKDADVSGMKSKIEALEADLQTKATEYAQQIADRDFNDMLTKLIVAADGKNAETIIKLMDVDALKASKNQQEDISATLKAMREDDVTSGMFKTAQPQPQETINPIGRIGRAPVPVNYLDEQYKGNPYYHPTK